MRVEQFRRVAGDSGFLLRLFECGRAREVLVDRMLPARRAGQRQTCTDAAKERLQRHASRTGWSFIDFDGSGLLAIRRVYTLTRPAERFCRTDRRCRFERALAPRS